MSKKTIIVKALVVLVGLFLLSLSTSFVQAQPAPVGKTGQTNCYDIAGNPISCTGSGQDGEYRKGVAWPVPRFTDHGNGTVTDNLIGLMWTKNAQQIAGGRTWQQAINECEGLILPDSGCNQYGDWRMPNVKEMQSLTEYGNIDPALPSGHPFTGVLSGSIHWTSTTDMYHRNFAWSVGMYRGVMDNRLKISTIFAHVWCVRGGP
jgi:hypothetical protein